MCVSGTLVTCTGKVADNLCGLVMQASMCRRTWTMVKFFVTIAVLFCSNMAIGQSILFDFDNAPVHSSLPVDLSVGGLTAHLSATAQGFSIQPANTLGFTPVGFSGYSIY